VISFEMSRIRAVPELHRFALVTKCDLHATCMQLVYSDNLTENICMHHSGGVSRSSQCMR